MRTIFNYLLITAAAFFFNCSELGNLGKSNKAAQNKTINDKELWY